jgi:DNA-directed RNA polymerase subunit RPC12/RpoP
MVKARVFVDFQCGECGALNHRGEIPLKDTLRFCPACGAAFERYCIRCRRKIDMYFEEWWAGEDECVRTYAPARRCPHCNAGLGVEDRQEAQ